jgi:hypothetical protein
MRNSRNEHLADTVLDLQCVFGSTSADEHGFETVPLIVVRPASVRRREEEEELHLLFEEAISERVQRVSQQLQRISSAEARISGARELHTDVQMIRQAVALSRARSFWQRHWLTIRQIFLGLDLLLLGFDLMGLFVLLR